MKVKWLGHAAFLIMSDEGIKIVTDPYKPGVYGLEYGSIKDEADIVITSHEHDDHNYVAGVPGNPQVIRGTGSHQANGIDFEGIACHHDESGGKERGENTIFCFTVNGVKLCHLGDLGHALSDNQVAAIGEVDILLIPVGGSFTIDATGADRVIGQIKPRVVVPMHFKTAGCPNFPVADAEPFLAGQANVKRAGSAEAEFKQGQLPPPTEIVVLKHAL
jgi:L-ascorbate metabolism protein UlaG (beta-lactamase superfamily)